MIALPHWWCIAMIVLNGRHEDIESSLHFLELYLLRKKMSFKQCIQMYWHLIYIDFEYRRNRCIVLPALRLVRTYPRCSLRLEISRVLLQVTRD